MRKCGGCKGMGRHTRWCTAVVGTMASLLGRMAEEADSMGDQIGPNNMRASNMAWQLAAVLREDAMARAAEYMAHHGTKH